MKTPKIVDVPPKMVKFYGPGKMLHPDREMVEAAIRSVPPGRLVTIDVLCQVMARQYGTDVTCPMRTGNFVKAISKDLIEELKEPDLPFWRVLRKDRLMINLHDRERWAAQLEDEGFELTYLKSGNIKVMIDEGDLYQAPVTI